MPTTNLNRIHLLLGNLDIWIYPEENRIQVQKQSVDYYGSVIMLPDTAILFDGSYLEFEKFLEGIK